MLTFIAKLFYVVFFISMGYIIIKYRRTVKGWTGEWFWAEKRLGRGGTYVILIFIGMLLIFYGAVYPFGGLDLLFGTTHKIGNL